MFEGRVGEYRLRRQKGGVGYFGQVRVRVAAAEGSGAAVVWRVDEDDTSSLQPGPDREFVDAALAGAADGLDLVSRCGPEPAGVVVEVVHAQFDPTDLEESAVRAAAALAVSAAFGVADRVELRFDAGWTVGLGNA
ncbi:hypothetical protein [Saccharothrix sp. NRRL B-16314]|uniref:hypothetical protein n=1 Tax=Saccharothrix sp. NRRL B-16314 TaxID=1463825 RepID=UPI00052589DB|nr:hypothetical protein [Saccharothrix sp. NRRL B-16314]